MSTHSPLKLAVIGGSRGTVYRQIVPFLPAHVELVAVCDPNPEVRQRWKEAAPQLQTYATIEEVIANDDIEAVVLATPMQIHVAQSVAFLNAGKHVLSEVSASLDIEGCWELVETVEKTGLTYMMAENFCYLRVNMMIQHMVEQGAFGELTHAECGYIHDVRSATHLPDGSLAWRGQLLKDYDGINYPTHSLGPVAQWLDINRSDFFDYIISISSKSAAQADYYNRNLGQEHPGSNRDFWKQGDSTLALIRTKNEVVIYMRNDFSSPRPWNYMHYGLQGTKASFASGREVWEEPVLWIDSGDAGTANARWQPLNNFAGQYEHPAWRNEGGMAQKASTLGEYFVLKEFAAAVQEKRPPAIDVYDSVTLSSVFPLSAQSIALGGQPVKFPNFTKNRRANNE